jgi:uncharacterized membrane protein SpoIIM required for sporulation
MVLEKLVSLKTAVRRPLIMFIVGDVVALVCLTVAFLVFRESIGLFTTLLITIAMTPFMVDLMTFEEARAEEELEKRRQMNLLVRHKDVLTIFAAFFGGVILALSIVFIMLPETIVMQLFQDQINEINVIRGNIVFLDTFERIVINNISVLMLSFLFSFLFGAGAIFILSWNASILATAIGMAAKTLGGFTALPIAVMVFFPHGSLEILAYFIGAVAGGLISAAVTRRKSRQFWFIVRDSLILIGVSIGVLLIAGGIETAAMSI